MPLARIAGASSGSISGTAFPSYDAGTKRSTISHSHGQITRFTQDVQGSCPTAPMPHMPHRRSPIHSTQLSYALQHVRVVSACRRSGQRLTILPIQRDRFIDDDAQLLENHFQDRDIRRKSVLGHFLRSTGPHETTRPVSHTLRCPSSHRLLYRLLDCPKLIMP